MILFFLKSMAWFYFFMPGLICKQLSHGLGNLLRLMRFRSGVVLQNLQIAYPGDSSEMFEIRKRLYKAAYIHLGHLVFEILMVLGPLAKFVSKNADLEGVENWIEAKQTGKGVIFLSSHLGNWEFMAARGALAGIDIMLITKHLKPEWLHVAIEKGRKTAGVTATYEPKTLRDTLSRLKSNKSVGFVLDQYAGPPVGVRVPFFGVPVGTATVVATLAKRTGAVVLPVVSYRRDDGRFTVEIRPALSWMAVDNPTRELAVNTALYTEKLEKDIRSHPEQWLWTHRRFKGDLSPLREDEWDQGRPRQ